jgi:hypothetical protein
MEIVSPIRPGEVRIGPKFQFPIRVIVPPRLNAFHWTFVSVADPDDVKLFGNMNCTNTHLPYPNDNAAFSEQGALAPIAKPIVWRLVAI